MEETMKCVKDNMGMVKRVPDERANEMVTRGWSFCPKSEWKAQERKSVVVMKEMTNKEVLERLDKGLLNKTNKKVKKSGKHKGETK